MRSCLNVVTARRLAFLPLIAAFLAAGCTPPDLPADNPRDPYSPDYHMYAPVLGTITVSGQRQVTVPIYSVDPYAQQILVERKDGSAGDFVQVGAVPASQQGYSENIPAANGTSFWYRARLKGYAGALSAYSVDKYVSVQ